MVAKLTGGLAQMAKQRDVTTVQGVGKFTSPNQIAVTATDGKVTTISFDNAIIAAGSQATKFPDLDKNTAEDDRIMDSTGALKLDDIPKKLLVIGGGIIGLEMGTVYDALGSKVSIVEFTDGLIQGCDRDLVRPLQKRMEKRFEKIMLSTKVAKMEAEKDGIHVRFEGQGVDEGQVPKEAQVYDRVLVSIGRRPNGKNIGAELAGVAVDEHGFIAVDKQMRTNASHIFAIGDIVGQPMLAHKAEEEGVAVAERIGGQHGHVNFDTVPWVIYTSPEIAWVGRNEQQLKADGVAYKAGTFPFLANGRARALGDTTGMVKFLADAKTDEILGVHMVGPMVSELISEAVVAMEFRASSEDIARICHAHPSLSEATKEAALAVDKRALNF